MTLNSKFDFFFSSEFQVCPIIFAIYLRILTFYLRILPWYLTFLTFKLKYDFLKPEFQLLPHTFHLFQNFDFWTYYLIFLLAQNFNFCPIFWLIISKLWLLDSKYDCLAQNFDLFLTLWTHGIASQWIYHHLSNWVGKTLFYGGSCHPIPPW